MYVCYGYIFDTLNEYNCYKVIRSLSESTNVSSLFWVLGALLIGRG